MTMQITCPECKGERRHYRCNFPDPGPVTEAGSAVATDLVVTKTLVDCETCGGTGRIKPSGRVSVFQDGRRIGTVPADFDPHRVKSKSPPYDVRPGDFVSDGDSWVAHPMLGNGDLEAVPGFAWAR